MAVEADSVVVELIAENAQFDAAHKASAAGFSKSMADIRSSGASAEQGVSEFSSALKSNRLEMNQSRIGMLEFQHIARGVSDQFASSGLSTQLFTSHIGELSEAVILSGGAFGKLGLFLQGPWGIALTLAGTAIATLIAGHKSHGSALDEIYAKLLEHKTQTDLNAKAEDIWAHSIDGLVDSTKKLNDELDKRLATQLDIERHTLGEAQFRASEAQNAQSQLGPNASPADVAKADAELTQANRALHDAQVLAGQQSGEVMADATKAAQNYSDELTVIIRKIQTLHPELAEANVAGPMQDAVDQVKKATAAGLAAGQNLNPVRDEVNRLTDALAHGTIGAAAFDSQMLQIAATTRASTEALKNQSQTIEKFKQSVIGAEGTGPNKLGSSAAGFGQFMPGTFEGYFKQLYPQQAAGLSNSQIDAFRNNREVANAVIDRATKDYVSVIQHAGQSITEASLYTVHLLGAGDARKLFAAGADTPTSSFLSAGVLRGNPFLRGTAGSARAAIAQRIGDSSGSVSSGAAAIQQQQLEAAKKASEQEAAFQAEQDNLNKQLIEARKAQVADTLAQLDIQEDEVRAEQKKRDDGYQSAVTLGKLTQAQASQLIVESDTLAAAKLRGLEIQKQIETIRREDEAAERAAQYRQDDLKALEAGATSQAQRRELDLQILDVLYDEKLAHLERLKLIAEGNGDIKAANDAQAQIDRLPQEKVNDIHQTLRGTMDPLESWLHSIPHDADAVTEALQGIAVNGFDAIASSIAGVVDGTETLGQAFGNVAKSIINDLVQMTIKMLIFRALSTVLGGGFDSASFSGTVLSNNAWAAGGGVLNSVTPAPALPSFAGGGYGIIGGNGGTDNNLLSLNGKGVAWVSNGEGLAIVPNNASATSGAGGGQSMLVVHVVSDDEKFGAFIEGIAGPMVAQGGIRSAYGGAAIARNNLARRQIHQLGSRG